MKNNWKCKFTEAIGSIKYAWSFPHNFSLQQQKCLQTKKTLKSGRMPVEFFGV